MSHQRPDTPTAAEYTAEKTRETNRIRRNKLAEPTDPPNTDNNPNRDDNPTIRNYPSGLGHGH